MYVADEYQMRSPTIIVIVAQTDMLLDFLAGDQGKGVAIGKQATREGLDVGIPAFFDGEVHIDGELFKPQLLQRITVPAAIPSTNPGKNAAGLTGTISLDGYRPLGIVGWSWDATQARQRNNFFHIYNMEVMADAETGEERAVVSVCNFHSTDAAYGTMLVHVLMAREGIV